MHARALSSIAAQSFPSCLQIEADKAKPVQQRQWLRCDIDKDGEDVLVCLAKMDILEIAARRGVGGPVYIDATHGIQKYGLKLTVLVKDEEGKGQSPLCILDEACRFMPPLRESFAPSAASTNRVQLIRRSVESFWCCACCCARSACARMSSAVFWAA
jgi:hypothetical protein